MGFYLKAKEPILMAEFGSGLKADDSYGKEYFFQAKKFQKELLEQKRYDFYSAFAV